MTKGTGAAVFASVVLAAAFVLASVEFRRMAGALAALDERMQKIETGAPAAPAAPADPGSKAAASGENASHPPATMTDVADELTKLRQEVAALRENRPHADAGGAPGAGSAGSPLPPPAGALSKEDFAKAVQDALVAKEKADKEKQARAYRKQMEVSAKNWAASLSKQLDLTEQQKEKLTEIFADQWTKMSTAWTDSTENENAEPYDYNKLQEQTTARVKEVLTPEQGTKYDEMMKKNQWGGWGQDSSEKDGE
jgi:hypothetical protein